MTTTIKSLLKKLNGLIDGITSQTEPPLIIAKYKFSQQNSHSKSGFLIITFNTVYVLQKKIFRNPIFAFKQHLLHCDRIVCHLLAFEIVSMNISITIKDKNPIGVVRIIGSIILQCTYNVDGITRQAIVAISGVSLESVVIKERPKNALRKRFVFFARYYDDIRPS
jgi:hypothetical protein